MLTKHAQILFEPGEYAKLTTLARKSDSSVGELVRRAIRITYFVKDEPKKEKKWPPKSTFGAWKDHPLSDDELMNLLSGEGMIFDNV